jgi:hypothetical protein
MSEFTFKDKHGTEWDLALTLGAAKLIDAVQYDNVTNVQFSFLNPDRDFFQEIFHNKGLIGAIAFQIISYSQLDKLDDGRFVGTTREEQELAFLSRLDGKSIRTMHLALLNAMADFFPEMETVLRNLIQKMDKVNNRLQKELSQMAEMTEAQFDQEIETAIAKTKKEIAKNLADLRGDSSSPVSAK